MLSYTGGLILLDHKGAARAFARRSWTEFGMELPGQLPLMRFDALEMALARRQPAPGLIWHSDQGSQFVSLAFGQAARKAGIAQSMGSRGDASITPSRRASSRRSRKN